MVASYPLYELQPIYMQPAMPVYHRMVRAVPIPADSNEHFVRAQRQSGGGGGDHHDVVDYGAHTGHHGAFGWYADFPVGHH